MPRDPAALSDPEVLFRYQIVSSVKALEHSGLGRSEAVRQVAGAQHLYDDVTARKVSERTIVSIQSDPSLCGAAPGRRLRPGGAHATDGTNG
jgi:hypothetical protein